MNLIYIFLFLFGKTFQRNTKLSQTGLNNELPISQHSKNLKLLKLLDEPNKTKTNIMMTKFYTKLAKEGALVSNYPIPPPIKETATSDIRQIWTNQQRYAIVKKLEHPLVSHQSKLNIIHANNHIFQNTNSPTKMSLHAGLEWSD